MEPQSKLNKSLEYVKVQLNQNLSVKFCWVSEHLLSMKQFSALLDLFKESFVRVLTLAEITLSFYCLISMTNNVHENFLQNISFRLTMFLYYKRLFSPLPYRPAITKQETRFELSRILECIAHISERWQFTLWSIFRLNVLSPSTIRTCSIIQLKVDEWT